MSAARSFVPINPADLLLPRLDGVRKAGRGWIARCPAHQDRSPSLSITEREDGVLLVHCHGGCEVADVCAAVGLKVGDLFPRTDTRSLTPQQRREFRQTAMIPRCRAALNVLATESTVLLLAADQLSDGHPLSPNDLTRVRVAALRVFDAKEVLGAR
ncbi:hypothetical protein [Rhodanobacter hydrolyticus]|uniref:DNA primase n=1 Tax=Rhodanobacter hydrolyticus TaxID=2250595 RepID=A0ABW8J6X0_9GAMM